VNYEWWSLEWSKDLFKCFANWDIYETLWTEIFTPYLMNKLHNMFVCDRQVANNLQLCCISEFVVLICHKTNIVAQQFRRFPSVGSRSHVIKVNTVSRDGSLRCYLTMLFWNEMLLLVQQLHYSNIAPFSNSGV
jgi:hypothetical protein